MLRRRRESRSCCALLALPTPGGIVHALPDVPVIASAHPSPMSADRGFFGSRPFSQANELLDELGGEPVDWALA